MPSATPRTPTTTRPIIGISSWSSDTHHEIVGFIGNVSLRDGVPLLHAHATFADEHGACVGGHLLRGITVFVAEFTIREMTGVELVRTYDEEFGLALW